MKNSGKNYFCQSGFYRGKYRFFSLTGKNLPTLHYRVNTPGDCQRNSRVNNCLVYSPYYPPHDGQAARIKERCVDNSVGLDGQRRCARQSEVQSKVDILSAPPAEAAVQVEHRLNRARQIGKSLRESIADF